MCCSLGTWENCPFCSPHHCCPVHILLVWTGALCFVHQPACSKLHLCFLIQLYRMDPSIALLHPYPAVPYGPSHCCFPIQLYRMDPAIVAYLFSCTKCTQPLVVSLYRCTVKTQPLLPYPATMAWSIQYIGAALPALWKPCPSLLFCSD